MKPLEVRCAHPVRLSPATHSQGHGRPCLQRPHPRRGFSATGSLLMVISMQCNSPCVLKRFPRTSWSKNVMSCVKWPDLLTPPRESHSKDQPGRGRRVETALAPEKGGDPRSGEDRRNPPSPSWCVTRICNCHWRKSINVTFYYEFRPISAVK